MGLLPELVQITAVASGVTLENLPTSHPAQDVAPPALVYIPILQLEHNADPLPSENVPGLHD